MAVTTRQIGLWIFAGALAAGQAAPEKLSFEVASVKPSAPIPATGGVFFGPPRGGPGTADPEQITWTYAALKAVLMKAYDVKAYQISGPAWLDSERYDIAVKVPPGTTKDQVNVMLQDLLAERFGLALHHDSREFKVDELVVAKGGPKFKETTAEDPNADGPPKMSKDGKLNSPGMVNRITSGPGGMSVHSMAKAQPISRLAALLGNQLNRPVLDMTGLNGKYDFELEFAAESGSFPALPPPTGQPRPAVNDADRGEDLATALQSQLGLKLVANKANLDVLVIDKANKVPIAN